MEEINNHRYIIHEMVHVRIHRKFGFKKWRIEPRNKNKDLICIMTLPKSILFPKYLPKIFLWGIFHLVHDLFLRFLIMDIINILGYMKNYFLGFRIIIKEILKEE